MCMTGTQLLANASRKKIGLVHMFTYHVLIYKSLVFFVEWASDILVIS